MSGTIDYHLADTVRTVHAGGKVVFHTTCKCGWHGADRTTQAAADDDATAHDRTENPIR